MALGSEENSGAERRRSVVLRAALMSGLATALLAGLLAEPASAYSLFGDPSATNSATKRTKRVYTRRWQQPQQTAVAEHPKTPATQLPQGKPQGPLALIVSIKSQRVTLYANGQQIAHSVISTGVATNPTPMGVFSVIEKDRHHRSNIYSGAPMPYMQRITWSGVALHEGFVTGHPASHGCIRLPQAFAAKLWEITELGVRVVVSPEDVTPHAITHERLFSARPRPAVPVAVLQPDPVPTAKIRLANNAETTDVPTVPVLEVNENDPFANGQSITDQIRAEATKDASAEPATGTVAEPAKAAEEPVKAAEPVKATEEPVRAAEPVKDVTTPEPAAPATAVAAAPAAPQVTEKPRELEKVRARSSGKEYPLKAGPITVLVSRQLGKVVVRKGGWPVFEAAVKIDRPDVPFGTHLFTALEQKSDGSMRWNVVSMANQASRDRRSPGFKEMVAPANPADVLNRITIPTEALDRISDLMTAGASFIVSDLGISPETTKGIDMIVQTR